jgi:transcriptional regulator with XRE-family HTH domain
MDQSPIRLHPLIAERVKKLRVDRGLSAQRLADELNKVGIPWERMVVTKLENGRRASVSVEELWALAYVLDVAPIDLVQIQQDGFVSITPDLAIPADEARAWARGDEPAPGQDPRSFFSEARDTPSMSPIEIARKSARILYHRRNGHLLREGKIGSAEYHRRAQEAVDAATVEVDDAR